MAVTYGVPHDDGISDHNKCYITQSPTGKEVTVIAYMTEECQLSLRALWESPFQGDNVGDIGTIDKAASLIQAETGLTSRTVYSTQEVWQGNEPPEITLTLKFIAYSNPKREVNDPIVQLLKMISPELKNKLPLDESLDSGRVPEHVAISIGRVLHLVVRLHEVSYDVNAPKTKDGYFAYNTVTITASPSKIINKSSIPNHFQ